MSVKLNDDDVIARLQSGAPGYPDAGPDAGRTLAAARLAVRRSRGRRLVGSLAAVTAAFVGLTVIGPIELPGIGTLAMPFGYDSDSLPDQGDPPVYPHDRLLRDVASLEQEVLPATIDLELTMYINEPAWWGRPGCRVFTWSHGAFRDRHSDCANPDDLEAPLDTVSQAAFLRVSDAIEHSGVNVYRIDKNGWGSGTSFHLRDNSWRWNWYYSYVPGTSPDPPAEIREKTNLGVRRQVHVAGNWWFTVEPDD